VWVFLGYIVTLLSVFGGYALDGGHVGALVQPIEFLMIMGAGAGSFIVGNNTKSMIATLKVLPTLLRGSKYNRAVYMELMALLYILLAKARKDGMMSLESDVDLPSQSPLFQQYPKIVADHHVLDFLTDYFRLMVSGNMNAFEIENLMDEEIETHHSEGEMPVHSLQRLGDAMPAFGIVAAVMGVVHTMASAGLPPSELGALIAQALVGTFLGILMSYAFISPLASLAEQRLAESSKMLQCIKVTILANLNGYAPALSVEFGRKVLFSTERPSFTELEDHVKQAKGR
jgi:chemotaxis protein MotA